MRSGLNSEKVRAAPGQVKGLGHEGALSQASAVLTHLTEIKVWKMKTCVSLMV